MFSITNKWDGKVYKISDNSVILNSTDYEYHTLIEQILEFGLWKENRTGTKTLSIFGPQIEFRNVGEEFPLISTKKIHLKSVIGELLWFLSGSTNKHVLKEKYGTSIWDEWKKPYTLNREIVIVDKKEKDYVEFKAEIITSGYSNLNEIDKKLLKTWSHIMARCYNENEHNHKFYKKVSVCEEWHDPLVFIKDVKKLHHWEYKKEDWKNFYLDKDYYKSNQYSPDTCVWLRKDENNKYTKVSKVIKVTFPNGDIKIFLSFLEASRELGISKGTLGRFMYEGLPKSFKQGTEKFKDYLFEDITDENILFRLKLIEPGELGPVYGHQWVNWTYYDKEKQEFSSINQLQNIIDTLKTNPDDRRMIVSAWAPHDINDMALPPCHWSYQFYTNQYPGEEKRRLHIKMNIRSWDIFLGGPFNIASYALLLMMMAQEVDMIPGDLIISAGDVHIYENHLEYILKQLSRESKAVSPKMVLNKNKGFWEFTPEDFNLEGYISHPNWKNVPVAI